VAAHSRRHDYLAHHLASGQRLERLRRLSERIDAVDVTRELAVGGPAGELRHAGAIAFAFAADPIAEIDAEHVTALEQREVERQLRNLAGGEADDEVTTLPGDSPQRRLAVRPADWIEDRVDAMLAALALERVAQVLAGVVDRHVGAVAAS